MFNFKYLIIVLLIMNKFSTIANLVKLSTLQTTQWQLILRKILLVSPIVNIQLHHIQKILMILGIFYPHPELKFDSN